jgi:uncharacterized protein
MFSLIPRDERYFDRFTEVATRVHEAARTLNEFFTGKSPVGPAVERVKQLEHECDEITHETLHRIDRTFITPIDRDDIHRLAIRLDDVIDLIDGTARRLSLYKIAEPTPYARQMGDVVVRITGEVVEGVGKLARRKGVIDHCIAIKKLETEGDVSYQNAVASLFAGEIPAIEVIKWKDVYENMERSMDACETVAHVLESAVWKTS